MRKRSLNKNTALKQLKLIALLQQEKLISIDTLAIELDVDIRTVYRYLEPLQNIQGFENKGKEYRIRPDVSNNIMPFNEKEIIELTTILNKNIDPILSNKILKVLTSIFHENEKIQTFIEKSLYKKELSIIQMAIDQNKKILLKKYTSRERVSQNRILSPVLLDTLNEKVYALDNGVGKTFNIENISGIDILNKPREINLNWDPTKNRDPFGFININPNAKKIKISLLLTNFAKSQLVRQFQNIIHFIKKVKRNDQYIFKLEMEVFDIQPIARFVSGLLNEVLITENGEAKDLIKEYIKNRIKNGMITNFGTDKFEEL
jgi:predicted DNA-binding transcriptional regulator YafY